MKRDDDFERVMRVVVEPVRRYLARRTDAATAEDVTSETLLVLWRRLDSVPDDVIPWAIGVARLQLANAERSARRQRRLFARIAEVDPPQVVRDHAEDDAGYIREAIDNLKAADAEVVRLWAWDDLDLAQIAQVLSISVNAATIRLHRARKRLREEIGKNAHSDGHVAVKEGEER